MQEQNGAAGLALPFLGTRLVFANNILSSTEVGLISWPI
jgi:hypothetical protein